MTKVLINFVLLPGLHGTDTLFAPFISAKPENIVIRKLNYPSDVPQTYKQLQQLVENEVKEIDTPFILVGESFSGPLSLFLAQTKPEKLIGVVLVGAFVTAPSLRVGKFMPWTLIFAMANLVFKPIVYFYRKRSIPLIVSAMIEVQKSKPSVLADRVHSAYAVDAIDALKSCPVPILYFRGTRDFVVPLRNLKLVQSIRPEVQVEYFNTSHAILQSEPDKAWEAILNTFKLLV